MAIDKRNIAELEKDGFTHIDACCASCGRIVQMPFKLLLTREKITKAKEEGVVTDARIAGVHTRRVSAPWRLGGSMG